MMSLIVCSELSKFGNKNLFIIAAVVCTPLSLCEGAGSDVVYYGKG